MPHSLSPYSKPPPPIIPLSLSHSFSCHLSQISQARFTSRRQVQVRSAEKHRRLSKVRFLPLSFFLLMYHIHTSCSTCYSRMSNSMCKWVINEHACKRIHTPVIKYAVERLVLISSDLWLGKKNQRKHSLNSEFLLCNSGWSPQLFNTAQHSIINKITNKIALPYFWMSYAAYTGVLE